MTMVGSRIVSSVAPKVVALATVFGSWQALVWSGWKPQYVLPAPATVFTALGKLATTSVFWSAVGTTLRRALVGYGVAVIVGSFIAVTVVRSTWIPADFGLGTIDLTDLRVTGPSDSAARIAHLLDGGPGAVRDTVLANAAAALWVAGCCENDLKRAVEIAAQAIDSGSAARLLERWGKLSRGQG